jgi:porphobilinogen deaminase
MEGWDEGVIMLSRLNPCRWDNSAITTMNAVKFCNFTDEDFTWKFDGIVYTFAAGQTIFLEDFKADHFAKHLIDRELNKKGLDTNFTAEREALRALIIPAQTPITPLEALQENATVKVKKPVKVKEEVEFEDLKA